MEVAVVGEEDEEDEVSLEAVEVEEAGRKITLTMPSLGTEAGGGTGPRAHLLEGSPQEESPLGLMIIPAGGTGPGQGTETGDTAHPHISRSPVPTTGHPLLLMTGLQLQAGPPPQLTKGHPPPAGIHQLMIGTPQPTLQAELLPPMTGPVFPPHTPG